MRGLRGRLEVLYRLVARQGRRLAGWGRHRGWRTGRFIVFVAIATVLWYLHKLNHEYTTNVEFPVVFQNHPPGKLLVGDPVRQVGLRVRGPGYVLLWYRHIGILTPLHINLRDMWRMLAIDASGRAVIDRQQLEGLLSGQLSSDIAFEGVVSDSLHLRFSELMRARRPVQAQVRFSIAEQCVQLGPVRIEPDSVSIAGPRASVERYGVVETEPLELGELHATCDGVASLPAAPDLDYEVDQVTYQIPVARYSEKRLRLPIVVDGLPDSLRATLLPSVVQLTCNVPVAQYDAVRADSFRVTAHYVPFAADSPLLLRITKAPAAAFNIDFEPKYAGLYLERKAR